MYHQQNEFSLKENEEVELPDLIQEQISWRALAGSMLVGVSLLLLVMSSAAEAVAVVAGPSPLVIGLFLSEITAVCALMLFVRNIYDYESFRKAPDFLYRVRYYQQNDEKECVNPDNFNELTPEAVVQRAYCFVGAIAALLLIVAPVFVAASL